MAIIELNNIRVSYETKKNKVDAVKDTTIHIEKGDILELSATQVLASQRLSVRLIFCKNQVLVR